MHHVSRENHTKWPSFFVATGEEIRGKKCV
jgi:hypothetical protein